MRRVFERQGEVRAKARQAQEDIERWHTPRARASFVADRWREIRKQHKKWAAAEKEGQTYTVAGYGNLAEEGDSSNGRKPAASSPPVANGSHRAFDSIKDLMESRQRGECLTAAPPTVDSDELAIVGEE